VQHGDAAKWKRRRKFRQNLEARRITKITGWFLGKMPQVECYATAETLKNP